MHSADRSADMRTYDELTVGAEFGVGTPRSRWRTGVAGSALVEGWLDI
jgi:hypothetical protein